jgi:hypothetical protein
MISHPQIGREKFAIRPTKKRTVKEWQGLVKTISAAPSSSGTASNPKERTHGQLRGP